MNEVDNKIVRMQFDNAEFERRTAVTAKSLEMLEKKLDMSKAAKGLEHLDRVGKSFSLSGVVDAVSMIGSRFTTMGMVGMTALQNIANTAVNAGKRIVSSLTVDPIQTGLNEYETMMGSVQTIMSNTKSKGTTLDDVNGALKQLNDYSDQTIYNFGQMAKNIGTFTAAGVDLDTSTKDIKGIANLAAVSGSSAEQASMAMYQLSQAVSNGTVRLMDWNSVVNAGMGGEVFQTALKKTAKLYGKNVDAMIKKDGSFRETLDRGWLTAEVLNKTLETFTGDMTTKEIMAMGYTKTEAEAIYQLGQDAKDAATKVKTLSQLFSTMQESVQSGWAQSWQLVIGDFEEARTALTAVSKAFGDIIGSSAEARNSILSTWKANGGRSLLMLSLTNIWEVIKNIGSLAKNVFDGIFPPMTAERLLEITDNFTTFTQNLKLMTLPDKDGKMSDTMIKLQSVFKGVASALNIVKQAGLAVWHVVEKVFAVIGPKILDGAAAIGEFISQLDASIKESKFFENIGNGLSQFFQLIVDNIPVAIAWITNLYETIKTFVNESEFLKKVVSTVSGAFTAIVKAVKNFFGFSSVGEQVHDELLNGVFPAKKYEKVFGKLKAWGEKISEFFSPIIAKIKVYAAVLIKAVKGLFGVTSLGDQIHTELLEGTFNTNNNSLDAWVARIKTYFTTAWTKVSKLISNIFEGGAVILSDLGKWLAPVIEKLKGMDLSKVLTDALGFYGWIKIIKAIRSFSRIGDGIGDIGKALSGLAKNGFPKNKQFDTLGTTLLKVAIAIGIIVGSIVVIANMEDAKLMKGMNALRDLAIGLVGVLLAFKFMQGANVGQGLLETAAAIALLMIPIYVLGTADPKILQQGILAVGAMLVGLALFTHFGKGLGKSTGLVAMAVALNMLMVPVLVFGNMNQTKLAQGLASVALLLGGMMVLMTFSKGLGKSTGLVAMAIALNLLMVPVLILSALPIDGFAKGVGGIIAMLLALGGAMRLASKGFNLKSMAGLIVAAGVIAAFAWSIKQIENVSWQTMLGFTGAFVGIIGAMVLATMILSKVPPAMAAKGALSLAIIAGGIGAAIAIVAAITGGAIANFSESVFQVGANLKGFANQVSKVSSSQTDKAIQIMIALADMAVGVAGKDPMGTNSSRVLELSYRMAELGANLALFSGAVALAGDGNVSKASGMVDDLYEVVTKLAALQNEGYNLADIGTNLQTLGGGLKLYAGSLKDFPTDGVPDSVNFKKIFSDLAANMPDESHVEDVAKYADGGGANLQGFANGLANVSTAIASYAQSISTLKPEAVTTSNTLLTVLSGLQSKLPSTGGVFSFINGQAGTLGSFATGIILVGVGIGGFAKAVKDIDSADVQAATDAISVLGKIQSELDKKGGIGGALNGEKDLADLGASLNSLTGGFEAFWKMVPKETVVQEAVARAVGAIQELGSIQEKLDIAGGLTALLNGQRSLADFGVKIELMATSLQKAITTISGIALPTNLDTVIGVLNTFVAFEERMGAIAGVYSIGDTGSDMEKLGYNLASFIDNVKGFQFFKTLGVQGFVRDMIDVTLVISDLQESDFRLHDIAYDIEQLGGKLKGFFEAVSNVNTSSGPDIAAFLTGVVSATKDLQGVDDEDIGRLASAIQQIAAISSPEFTTNGTTLANIFITGFTNGVANGVDEISKALVLVLTTSLLSMSHLNLRFASSGVKIVSAVLVGMETKKEDLKTGALAIVDSVNEAIRGTYQKWYDAGAYLGEGLVKGIASKKTSIFETAQSVYNFGFASEKAITSGLSRYAELSSIYGQKAAESSIQYAKASLSGIASSTTDTINSSLTLRPVVDLSNVSRSANTLSSGLFSASRDIEASRLNANSLALNNQRATNSQNGIQKIDNSDVVSAIKRLDERVSNLGSVVGSLKVYLNTGTLVGEIAPRVDTALGGISGRKGRA